MEVYLIRHTQVDINEPLCYGQTDLPVKSTFPEEAAQTSEALSGLTFDKVYCSPLQRAAQLAAFCGYPDAERDNRLKEMFMGDLERIPFRLLPTSEIDKWYNDFIHIEMPGGESTEDVIARMGDFFEELRKKPYRRVAVFYHACAILCTQMYFGIKPRTAGFNEVLPYGGVTKIEI